MTIPGFEAFIDEFLLDANERVRQVQDLLLKTGSAEGAERETVLNDLKRELHTLKGNAGMMGFTDIQGLAHEMEENLQESEGGEVDVGGLFAFLDQVTAAIKALSGAPKVAPEEESQLEEVVAATEPPEGSVRIPFSALDELMDLLAEMVIIRNQLTDAVSPIDGLLGYILGLAGRRTEALEELDRLKDASKARYVPPTAFALIHAGLGDLDRSFKFFDRAFEERVCYLTLLKFDPLYDPLRHDPRFDRLLERIGFPSNPPAPVVQSWKPKSATLAILPFHNTSQNSDTDYLSNEIPASIIDKMAGL